MTQHVYVGHETTNDPNKIVVVYYAQKLYIHYSYNGETP